MVIRAGAEGGRRAGVIRLGAATTSSGMRRPPFLALARREGVHVSSTAVLVPPRNPARSTRSVRAPFAAAIAATMPALPAPATITSAS
jgi:hypothetical protein